LGRGHGNYFGKCPVSERPPDELQDSQTKTCKRIFEKRLKFALDNKIVSLLENLAKKFYDGNKSQTVCATRESLVALTGHQGWVITGYTPKRGTLPWLRRNPH
jgi:hypothetical protein